MRTWHGAVWHGDLASEGTATSISAECTSATLDTMSFLNDYKISDIGIGSFCALVMCLLEYSRVLGHSSCQPEERERHDQCLRVIADMAKSYWRSDQQATEYDALDVLVRVLALSLIHI